MTTKTLERLASTFTVRDVMVPRNSLVCGEDEDECGRLLAEHQDFNVIPIKVGDRLTGYVERELGRRQIDFHEDVISDSTSLLDLIDVLRDRTFSFVLTGSPIAGYVHFSDLNNRLVELSLYVLLQAVEHHLIGRIKPLGEGELQGALGGQRARLLQNLLRRLAENQADLDDFSVMQLKDFLRIARFKKVVTVTDDEIVTMYRVRNAVSHAQMPLVKTRSDVRNAAWVKDFCAHLIGSLGLVIGTHGLDA